MSQNNLLSGYDWETPEEEPEDLQFTRSIEDENDLHLDVVMDSEMINADSTVSKLLAKEGLKYKILEQNVNIAEDKVMMYPHSVSENSSSSSSTAARLIDKDDPRSRLHFVKYLKREGKTIKIWECGICCKEFRHQYTLMRHLPTHTDERNFKCEACGKAFRQLSTLSQHRAIHSDARPYVCEFCKKTFNRVSTLISHRKTHSEHKPHKCHLCGKGFHQKGNLRNHVFTHTNERPYKCDHCGKGFNQMSNLVCHKVKSHAHDEKMKYVCGICGKEFPRRFSLRSHEEYKHGIKYRHCNNHHNNNRSKNQSDSTTVLKNKNVRIVHISNEENNETPEENRERDVIPSGEFMESIVIDKINTKELENAILQDQTPFALFKPCKGVPVLVKVTPTTEGDKHTLTPATADDLRTNGKMSLNSTVNSDIDGTKAVQVKVPVVATISQKMDTDGKFSFIIEPPGPEQDEESLLAPFEEDLNYTIPETDESLDNAHSPNVNFSNNNCLERPGKTIDTPDDCNELLELAAQGGIQFVRATEDGRYEVMTSSEARDLMAQNSHDVTILDEEEAEAINVINIRNNNQVVLNNNCTGTGANIGTNADICPNFGTGTTIDTSTSTNTHTDVNTSVMSNSDTISGGIGYRTDNNNDNSVLMDDKILMLNGTESIPSLGQGNKVISAMDHGNDHEMMSMDDEFKIFQDKDIRILESKSLDDRFIDNIAFLSQPPKISDLILTAKPMGIDSHDAFVDVEQGTSMNGDEISSFLNHRNELTPLAINPTSMSSLLKSQSSLSSLLNDTNFTCLKQSQILNEDLSSFFESTASIIPNSGDFGIKMRLNDGFMGDDDAENSLLPFQSDIKLLGSKVTSHNKLSSNDKRKALSSNIENIKILGPKNTDILPNYSTSGDTRIFNENRNMDFMNGLGSYQDIKILGSKKPSAQDSNLTSHYQDMKILEQYEQFLKNQAQFSSIYDNNNFLTKKDMKVIGKKIDGIGDFCANDDAKILQILDDKKLELLCNNEEKLKLQESPILSKQSSGSSDSFLIQPCSPTEFLSMIENRLPNKDSFESHFDMSQKDFPVVTGLPDLD